ncbi:MAG TPA: hypothetical protein VIW94_01150 [Acidimicrobiia bacterium]
MPDTDLDPATSVTGETDDDVEGASEAEKDQGRAGEKVDPGTDDDGDTGVELIAEEPAPNSESEDPPDARTPIPTWKKLTAAGSWIVAVFFLVMFLANGSSEARDQGETSSFLLPQDQVEVVPPDTLGIRFDEVRETWNTVEQAPLISSPLRRTPESGEFDSFFYGLDPKAEILGAYRDSDDYLVGLLVTARLDHEAISTLYLHVCHIVSPFSPDCIEQYTSIGLANKTLADLAATGSETNWMFDGNTWRVTVSDRQLTIRVISPASE